MSTGSPFLPNCLHEGDFEVTRKIVSERDIEALAVNGVVEVDRAMIVTPLAREYASRKGIRLVYGRGAVPSAEAIPRSATGGGEDPDMLERSVAREVARVLSGLGDNDARTIPSWSPLATAEGVVRINEAREGEPGRAVIVATGANRPGVAAALTSAISATGTDIEDISQTIVAGFFSMIFVANMDSLKTGQTFKEFKEKVEVAGRGVGAEIVVMHEAILKAMHRV